MVVLGLPAVESSFIYRDFLAGPAGAAIGPDGAFYVADVVGRHVVRVDDEGTMSDLGLWGDPDVWQEFDDRGAREAPNAVAFGIEGELYISSEERIYEERNGDGRLAFESEVSLVGGVAVDPRDGVLYFTDSDHPDQRRVFRLLASGAREPASEPIPAADHLAFGTDGSLYVGTRTGTIYVVDVATQETAPFVQSGRGEIVFIAVDPEGDLWVRGANLLEQFAPDGTPKPFTIDGQPFIAGQTPLGAVGGDVGAGIGFDDQGRLWLAGFAPKVIRYEPVGNDDFRTTPLYFGLLPSDLVVGPDGDVYVYSLNHSQVWRIGPDNTHTVVAQFGFFDHARLAIDDQGTVYVAVGGSVYRIGPSGEIEPYVEGLQLAAMAFGHDGNLYGLTGVSGPASLDDAANLAPTQLVRISSMGDHDVVLDAIDGEPLAAGRWSMDALDDGILIQPTEPWLATYEQLNTVTLVGYDGTTTAHITTNPDPNFFDPGGHSFLFAADSTGNVYHLAVYQLSYYLASGGNGRLIAAGVVGDPLGIDLDETAGILYIAEYGTINAIQLDR